MEIIGASKKIMVADQIKRHLDTGYMWSGWMGGQWAMTDQILGRINRSKGLLVLCGGPGDLAYNACLSHSARFAINVDSSYSAIDYGLWLKYRYLNHLVRLPGLSLYSPTIDYPAEVEAINRRHNVTPGELKKPQLLELLIECHGTGINVSNVYHVWEDARLFVDLNLCKLPPVDVYIASPTIFDDAEGGTSFSFHLMYDHGLPLGDKTVGFREWYNKEKELAYLERIVNRIHFDQPEANILFGVGSGNTTLEEYMSVGSGVVKVLGRWDFQTFDGVEFTDWLLKY